VPVVTDVSFPRSARVRARADFDRVFKLGRRTSDPLISLHWLREDVPARFGLAVSRKVDPRAVTRNRIKRALREQFRRHRLALAPGSYVVVARGPAAGADGSTLRTALSGLLVRAGALPPIDAPGTMPASPSSASAPPTHPRAGRARLPFDS